MTAKLTRSEYRNTNTARSEVRKAIKRAEPVPVRSRPIKFAGDKPYDLDALLKELDQESTEFLDGTPVKSARANVPVEKLKFWMENPRLLSACGVAPETQAEVIEGLLAKEHEIADLTLNIQRNGGLPEPILVVPEDDNFLVMEGNRRTLVCMILSQVIEIPDSWPKNVREEIAKVIAEKPFPKQVPVILYKDMTKRQWQARLATDHISGKKQWTPLQKAQFALQLLKERSTMDLDFTEIADLRKIWKELSTVDQETLKEVAQTCGYSGNKMNELRYRVMACVANCLYCGLYDTEKQGNKFDVLRRFYSQKWWRDMAEGAQPRLMNDETNEPEDILWKDKEIEEKFLTWLSEGKISETLHMDSLHKVLSEPDTREIFEAEGKGFKEAFPRWRQINDERKKAKVATQKDVDEMNLEEVFTTACMELRSIRPNAKALKAKANESVRATLHDLKAAIAALEATLGEAL